MEEIQNSNDKAEGRPTRRPRTRIDHDRSRVVRGFELIAPELPVELNVLTLTSAADYSQDEWEAYLWRIGAALHDALDGVNHRPPVEDYDTQIRNFHDWQLQMPTIYHWPEAAENALRAKLEELGPGCRLIPLYAMSIGVKLPSGRLTLIDRQGRETKG